MCIKKNLENNKRICIHSLSSVMSQGNVKVRLGNLRPWVSYSTRDAQTFHLGAVPVFKRNKQNKKSLNLVMQILLFVSAPNTDLLRQ